MSNSSDGSYDPVDFRFEIPDAIAIIRRGFLLLLGLI
jgi:hypothetical protein